MHAALQKKKVLTCTLSMIAFQSLAVVHLSETIYPLHKSMKCKGANDLDKDVSFLGSMDLSIKFGVKSNVQPPTLTNGYKWKKKRKNRI
jgi:hypothetical protein